MYQTILIAARSSNNVIGRGNSLPWKLPSDLKNFRQLTNDNVVVMGRKTFESIGRPLSNRFNVVISSSGASSFPGGVLVCSTIRDAVKTAREALVDRGSGGDIYIIGGGKIYESFMKRADRIILTTILQECEGGDTFFPKINEKFWKRIKEEIMHDEAGYMLDKPDIKGLDYTIVEYERVV